MPSLKSSKKFPALLTGIALGVLLSLTEPALVQSEERGASKAKVASVSTQKYNRLIHEKSPYLLQHAHNPVHWFPWEKEAFQAALALNQPIFLSIGILQDKYSEKGQTVVYVCENNICKYPTGNLNKVQELVEERKQYSLN